MLILYQNKLQDFGRKHVGARKDLNVWRIVVEKVHWKMKQDVLTDFPKAKMIKNNRARFEIVHNTYRLIALIRYVEQIVEIRFIGTHNEYDKIEPETI
ncbi:MAG: type II toxin-antitoxin system HigB family toxin [Ginsengibacter sp.]